MLPFAGGGKSPKDFLKQQYVTLRIECWVYFLTIICLDSMYKNVISLLVRVHQAITLGLSGSSHIASGISNKHHPFLERLELKSYGIQPTPWSLTASHCHP